MTENEEILVELSNRTNKFTLSAFDGLAVAIEEILALLGDLNPGADASIEEIRLIVLRARYFVELQRGFDKKPEGDGGYDE